MTMRIVTAAIGLLFVVAAVVILFVADGSVKTWIGAGVVGGLGLDALVSALRDRRSLLARIGPLP